MDREEQEETDFRLLSKRSGGGDDAVVSEQMSQIGKEKKRRPKGLVDPQLNSYPSKSAKYLCGALGRIASPGCQSKF